MKIRFKHDIGVCEGYNNIKRGDVIDVPEASGRRYVGLGYADAVSKRDAPVEKAVEPQQVETATVEVPADAPKPLDEDESEDSKPARPTPQRRR
jgi:hypothetical protein